MACYRFGPFLLDSEARILLREGEPVPITGKALDTLLLLVQNRGRLLDKDELLSRVWPGTVVEEANLTQSIFTVRKALGDRPKDHRYIATVPGRGYQFVAPVTEGTQTTTSASGSPTSTSVEEVPSPPVPKASPIPRRFIMRQWVLSAGVLFLVGLVWFVGSRLSQRQAMPTLRPIQSLAVLPLTNLSHDESQEYFTDGLTEELITELAKTNSWRVISRTSAMRYKNAAKSVPEIARELNVDALVEGAVMRSGTRIRITMQLIRASPERHLWAETYEGEIQDVLNIQHEMVQRITNTMQNKLVPTPAVPTHQNRRLDPETYENYLRGRHFLAQRNAEAMKKARAYFEQVIQREPQYAPAYAGLAVAYELLGTYEVLPPEQSFPKMKEFANQALQLDNTLAEAYTVRGIVASFWEFNWAAADQDFRRAIALDPSFSLAHQWYAEHWTAIGKAERAVAEAERARELDPLSLHTNSMLGRVYRDAHQYEKALRQCRKALELDPHYAMAHWCLGQVYIGEHRYAEAIRELERAHTLGTTPLILRDLGWAYAAAGHTAQAREILTALRQGSPGAYVPPYSIAVIYGALGEKEEAFRWLERACQERDSQITHLALDPKLDPLRSDSRFPPLLQRLHLPP